MPTNNPSMQQEKTRVLQMFRRQTWASLVRNTRTQHIWPQEIYPGFTSVNEYRRKHKKWYATGQGSRSFEVLLISSKDGNETIVIRFAEEMRFAEMGVGKGRPFTRVEHDANARFDQRYISRWVTKRGSTHRPAIAMEARNLQERMKNYLRDFYGRYVEVEVYRTIGGFKPIDLGIE